MNSITPQYQSSNQSGVGMQYDSRKSEILIQEQEQRQQYNCAFCKRIAIKPISLICNHNLCLTCANFLKEQESDSGIQQRFRVSCPSCQANTVTYNVKNLLVQNGPEKLDSETPLKILSVQTSPSSKRNLRKGSLAQIQINKSSSKDINTLDTSYNVSNSQTKTKNHNNNSWNSLESHNQRNHSLQSSNKLYGQQYQQLIDKPLQESHSQQGIKNQSLGTPFSTNKNGNTTIIYTSPNTHNTHSSQNNQYNKNNSQSSFFAPQQANSNSQDFVNDSHANSYVKCLQMMPSSQNYVQTTIGSHNCLTTQNNCQNSSTSISQSNLKPIQQQMNQCGQNYRIGSSSQSGDQVKCHSHSEQYSLFCLSDKSLLCVECLYSQKTHKSHNIIPLKNAHQILKKENEDFKIQSETYLKKLQSSLQIVKQNKVTLDREHTKSSQKINEIFDSMVFQVNARRQKLLEQLDKSYETHMSEVDSQSNELLSIKDILEEYKNFDEQIAENAYSEPYIFSAFKMIQQTLEQTNLDPKPIKLNFNIMQVENSHKMLFNKLLEKIVQLQSSKVDGILHQTKCQKQQSTQYNNTQNSTINTNQNSNINYAYAPNPYNGSKEPTPKKYSSANSHNILQNSSGKSYQQSINNSATSSQGVTQRGNNKKSASNSFSEKVQKRLNTQACSKTSYKNIKRKLSTDFGGATSSSKENIHVYSQYQQNNLNMFTDIKKRSQSMQGENIFDPMQLKAISSIQQSYEVTQCPSSSSNQIVSLQNESHQNKQIINQGNLFLREKYSFQNYQTNTKDTATNSTNMSQKRSPFKEYIIN